MSLWVLLDRSIVTRSDYSGTQAGGSLFRVHGYFFFRDSSMFRAKLKSASPGKVKEGTIDFPVMLDGVTDEEFEMLLWVFYNPYISFINMFFQVLCN